jgi:RNA 2',3'-cyclic 3'-phosphodiesterase
MRLFLAINPPLRVRSALWNATTAVRDAWPDVSWVAEPRIHLTLKFLGEQPDAAAEPLADAIRGVARSHAAPQVRVAGIGAFPNLRRPNVVWIGVEPEPRLELLHHDVEVACDALGYEIDGRPFRPHFTLGRVKARGNAEQIRALGAAARKVRFSDDFMVESIDVMHSALGPAGPTYTTLVAAPLRAS